MNRKEDGTRHEGTKDTKGSDIYTLKLRELRAFVVNIFSLLAQFWLRHCRAVPFVANSLAFVFSGLRALVVINCLVE